ncbi:MAG: PrsW family intramembrane metalloprotease [Candidatus Wallbacteria bacterium]|nr:PrsW family intramembrane metalloprotease [Candidatus Wallbacteria bacterium]
MNSALTFVLALVPGLCWLFFLTWRSRRDLPFRKTLLKVFALGMVVCIPAGYFNVTLMGALFGVVGPHPLLLLMMFLFVVGPVEEGLKFLILYSEVYTKWQIRRAEDGVLLATASALGFATFENFDYAQKLGLHVLLTRAWACALLHVGFSAIFGHYMALAKLRRYNAAACIGEGLFLAAMLHGTYDFSVSTNAQVMYPFVAATLVLYWMLRHFDWKPLSVRLVPALEDPGGTGEGLQLFRRTRFPRTKGRERTLADSAIAEMDADETQRRLDGLSQAAGLHDSAIYDKVEDLTHDPVAEVRALADEVLAAMQERLRGKR